MCNYLIWIFVVVVFPDGINLKAICRYRLKSFFVSFPYAFSAYIFYDNIVFVIYQRVCMPVITIEFNYFIVNAIIKFCRFLSTINANFDFRLIVFRKEVRIRRSTAENGVKMLEKLLTYFRIAAFSAR